MVPKQPLAHILQGDHGLIHGIGVAVDLQLECCYQDCLDIGLPCLPKCPGGGRHPRISWRLEDELAQQLGQQFQIPCGHVCTIELSHTLGPGKLGHLLLGIETVVPAMGFLNEIGYLSDRGPQCLGPFVRFEVTD